LTNYQNNTSTSYTDIKWTPPYINLVKLNFDGSVNSDSSAASRFIIRNSDGLPLFVATKNFGSSKVHIAEAFKLLSSMVILKFSWNVIQKFLLTV
jgi:hypothetical protein